jgi:2,3-bisphosphoglycerate-independent phosphoglycerate mutase
MILADRRIYHKKEIHMSKSPVVLIILDGWGLRSDLSGNAVAAARTPCFDSLWRCYPHTELKASGGDVGLPDGIMGNSEVGHLNLGAGRVVEQAVSRINQSIEEESFFRNEALTTVVKNVRDRGGRLHIAGLMSDGLVHSAQRHYMALLDLARRMEIPSDSVFFHAILDGRDTAPQSAPGFLEALEQTMERLDVGRVASVSGRYYAMDRDNRWERIQLAYEAMVGGVGHTAESAEQAVNDGYERGETDEFVLPTIITENGTALGTMADGDGLVFFNYRADRGRELLRSVVDPQFVEFDRGQLPDLDVVTMTQYDSSLRVPFAYQPPDAMPGILGETISVSGRRQLRVAETEKYAHVTYFFNGGREAPFEGEDRTMVPSPKWVATYDEQPEMSCPAVAWKVVNALRSGAYDFILVNFANPDMVGHTGSIPAAKLAVEAVDWSLKNIVDTVHAVGGKAIVTADHGNAELMTDQDSGKPHTAHTTNPVPLIVVEGKGSARHLREDGRLADVAPTVLGLMDLPIPAHMSGVDLRIQ